MARKKLESKPSEMHARKGFALTESGNLVEAIVELRAAVTLDPWHKIALKNLALALRKTEDLSGALSAYQRLVVLDSQDASAHNALGNVWQQLGDPEAAMEAYTEAIRLDPSDWAPRLNIATILLKKRRIESAILHIEKTLSIHPKLPEAERLLRTVNRKRHRGRVPQKLEWVLRRMRRRKSNTQERLDPLALQVFAPPHLDGRIECAYNKAGTRAALSLIKQEFTEEWLSKHKPLHEIQKMWKLARRFVDNEADPNAPPPDLEVVGLVKFASDLSWGKTLTGYEDAIPARLKGPDLEKVKYEVFVASVLAQGSHKAEFIPRSRAAGVKTADLKILHPSKPIFVECKRKDKYVLESDVRATEWKPLVDETVTILGEAEADLDVTYFVPAGSGPSDLDVLLDSISALVDDKHRGLVIHQESGVGILIRELMAPISSDAAVIALPARRINLSTATINMKMGEDGRVHPSHPRRVCVWFMDSHKLQSIVNSFNTARHQIPEDGPGIIYIDLDISQLDLRDIMPYLDCMSASVRTLFSPNSNTRVGAVVLTTQPVFFQYPSTNGMQADHQIISYVVQNMYAEELINVPAIPGSKHFRTDYTGEATVDYGMDIAEIIKKLPLPLPD